ncbi:MAG: LysR family transcriptional regulator [bacterium]|nr:LysR family transcriptional regulator [Gammaproteobacteria bacterium]HIL98364.1 LysR family transcriptional regulator [Pseudomonadales bacterium]
MPIHIDINEVRVFKSVYEQNGFKKAADKLFVTQSAVSQTIANLEHKLDSLLLERNPLKLTEAGIRLLNYAEIVLNEEQSALDDIKNIKNGILSTLLLSVNGSINILFGQKLIQAYCQDSPLTRIKINVMPSRQIINAIGSDLWELGFGPFQQQMPTIFETLPLFSDERVLMISQEYPGYEVLVSEPESILQTVPLIVSHLDDQDMRPAMQKLRDSFGTIWEINDIDLRVSLVEQGLGMSYLDQKLVESDTRCNCFVPLDALDFARIPLQFGIFYRKGKPLSMGARRFVEVCEDFVF